MLNTTMVTIANTVTQHKTMVPHVLHMYTVLHMYACTLIKDVISGAPLSSYHTYENIRKDLERGNIT